nr:SUMF1/EgtB/PvdO family nonheme iron enzyme [Fusobacterium nucleatum]
MQEKIKKFFNENNFLLWIKTNNYLETEKKLIKNFQFLENKKLYIYQNKITINQETGNKELNMNNLYNTLDELYPQGIRKKITILLVKESFEEILEKQNIDYIKEIIEIKKNNPNYNFKLIVISDNSVPEKLSNLVYFIDEKILTEENNVKEFILDFLKNEEAQLNTESINKIINILKDDIKKEGKEYNENKIIKNQFENMVVVEEGKYIPSFIDNEIKVSNIEVSKYLVTQDLWEEIMGYNPSYFKGGQKPVENVTWWDALKFCNKLSKKYGLEPVYDLNQDNILMINQLGKNKVEGNGLQEVDKKH